MGMGAYESIARAGIPQPEMENPNAVLVDSQDAERNLHKRASDLYNQIQEYHKVYGGGQQRMDYETARRYHNLSSAFHEAMKQWEHYQNKNRSESNVIDPMGEALENDTQIGTALRGAEPKPALPKGQQGNAPIGERLRNAGQGVIPGGY